MESSYYKKRNHSFSFVLLILIVFVLSFGNMVLGSVPISLPDVLKAIFYSNFNSNVTVIIKEYRLPQVFTAIATGMGLGVAGLLLQTVFRNPLAGPSVLGISAGASLGVAVVLLAGSVLGINFYEGFFSVSDISIVLAAFGGALTVLALIMFVSGKIGNIITVLIIGIMIGYLVSAVVGVLQFFSGSTELQDFVLWGLGSFAKNTLVKSLIIFISTLFIILTAFLYIKPLNAMLLGENYARSTGYDIIKSNRFVLLISGLLIALGTAFTGPIAFIGLAVPHLARMWFNTSDHKNLIPATLLIGANLALFCNIIARLPGTDTLLPINAVTSVIGAPVVIWVIIKRSKIKVS
jgi:iron complex transport system permease protein